LATATLAAVDGDVSVKGDAATASADAASADDVAGRDGAAADTAAYRAPTTAVSERHNDTTGFMNRSAYWTSAVRP
jgi:hypothetical protein